MKTLIFLLFCLPLFVQAVSTLEEGLILQQELRFLEDVATAEVNPASPASRDNTLNSSNDLDLESTYFSDEVDEVRTRQAAPRRRR